uniref:Uncharacterized protein n=1 Tax=Romanomermis culicivorax TaxID=13658 RepID=A0A915JFC6_ROMCU
MDDLVPERLIIWRVLEHHILTSSVHFCVDENSPLNAQPTVDEGSEDTTTTSDYYYYYYDGETTGNNDQDTTVAQMTTVGGNQL